MNASFSIDLRDFGNSTFSSLLQFSKALGAITSTPSGNATSTISSLLEKIPSVILLLLLGWGVRQLTDLFSIEIPDLNALLPAFGTIGLILIVQAHTTQHGNRD